MAGISPNAYVGFLAGTQASIDNLLAAGTSANAKDGSFYLTNDTHRLYIGNSDGSISPVNQGVRVIASVQQLPDLTTDSAQKANVGQFYYLSQSNILCIASGSEWVQINPDHTLYDERANITVTTTTDANGKRSATISDKIRETQDGGLSATANYSSGDFTIKSGDNVWITVNTDTRTITLEGKDGARYSLTAAKNNTTNNVELSLTNLNDSTDVYKVALAAGDSGVTPVWDSVNNCIAFHGGGLKNGTISISETNGVVTLDVSDGINHARKNFTPTITIGNTETTVNATYNTTTDVLDFNLDVYTKDEIDTLLSGSFQNFESMYMAGLIGTGGSITSWAALANHTSIRSGATFKVISEMEIDQSFRNLFANANIEGININASGNGPDAVLEVGDMIVVTCSPSSIDTTTGFIDMSTARATTGGLTIYVIPSGDDNDVYYTPDTTQDNKVVLTRSYNDGLTPTSHTLQFAAGTDIILSNDHSQGTAQAPKNVLTVSHSTITTSPTTGASITQDSINYEPTINAITGLTVVNGHVTGYTTQQIKLWTNDIERVTTVATSSTSNGAKLVTVAKEYAMEKQGSSLPGDTHNNNNLVFSSHSLDITTPGGTASGTADGTVHTSAEIQVEMKWGTFSSGS